MIRNRPKTIVDSEQSERYGTVYLLLFSDSVNLFYLRGVFY